MIRATNSAPVALLDPEKLSEADLEEIPKTTDGSRIPTASISRKGEKDTSVPEIEDERVKQIIFAQRLHPPA